MQEVLASTRFVQEQSRFVHMDDAALRRFVDRIADRLNIAPAWDTAHHFRGSPEDMAGYLVVLDTVNFCFWALPGSPRWKRAWGSKQISGYHGLAVALKEALESGTPITDGWFLQDLDTPTFDKILGGSGRLPLVEERVSALNDLGRLLVSEYSGRAIPLIEEARGSAVALARLLAARLDSFRDVARYRGQEIFFYKRAQILAADLYQAFGGKLWGAFSDIDRLTAFADYKLPQVLRHLGVLDYHKDLSDRIDCGELIEPGSVEEVEIRANTICAVERIRQCLKRRGDHVPSCQIDSLLWHLGQDDSYREKPYHKTLTIFY